VIKVTALRDASGRYYLEDPAPEVNGLTGASSSGVWMGAGASRLRLAGPVTEQALGAVLSGSPPSSTLVSSPRRSLVGFDLIFAAPKCVSVLFASRDHEVALATVEAHHAALDAAVGYLDHRVLSVVRADPELGERVSHGTQGAIAARFTHGTSRSGDPHLHSHLVVANLAHGLDGRFGAIDRRAVSAHRSALDALYRAQLRHEIATSLGERWELTRDGREQLASVDDAAVVALSGRRAERASGEYGFPKKISRLRDDAERLWAERLARSPELTNAERSAGDAAFLDEHHFAAILHGRTVRARDVVEAWCRAARGGVEATVVARALDRIDVSLGHGLYENPLLARQVHLSPATLRALGPRPVRREPLERWWTRQQWLERPRRNERLAELGAHQLIEIDRELPGTYR
jgi:conjugative relaxase-like TrwC/TraI family protein